MKKYTPGATVAPGCGHTFHTRLLGFLCRKLDCLLRHKVFRNPKATGQSLNPLTQHITTGKIKERIYTRACSSQRIIHHANLLERFLPVQAGNFMQTSD